MRYARALNYSKTHCLQGVIRNSMPTVKPKRYVECPFCSGVLEPKLDKMKCPECHVKFEYGNRMESVFADTDDLRLPVLGSICPQCGSV